MTWPLVDVVGTWSDPDTDELLPGRWAVVIPERLTRAGDADIIPAGLLAPGWQDLNTTPGEPSLQVGVPAFDDPSIVQTGWVDDGVQVRVTFTGGQADELYLVRAPWAARRVANGGTGAGVDLAEEATASPTYSGQVFYQGPRGVGTVESAGDLTVGDGSPEGVVTAPPDALYVDVAGPGPRLWVKATGSGNTGWVRDDDASKVAKAGDTMTGPLAVPVPSAATQVPRLARTPVAATGDLGLPGYAGSDTGWRGLGTAENGWVFASGGKIYLRRVGSRVTLIFGYRMANTAATSDVVYTLTDGWNSGLTALNRAPVGVVTLDARAPGEPLPAQRTVPVFLEYVSPTSDLVLIPRASGSSVTISGAFSWETIRPWPTSLPGTQVTAPAVWS